MNSLSTPNNIFPTSPLPQNTKAGQKVYKESLAISVSSLKNSGTSVSQKCTYNQEEQSTTQGIFFSPLFLELWHKYNANAVFLGIFTEPFQALAKNDFPQDGVKMGNFVYKPEACFAA